MRRALLSLVVVCTTWGTIPLLARRVELPPGAIVFVRVWVGAAGLAVVALLRGHDRRTADSPAFAPALGWRAILVGPLLAVHWTAMFAGYQHAPDDIVVFVVFLAPVGIALAAPAVLGERLTRSTIAALAVAVVGFVLVTAPSLGAGGESGSRSGIAYAALSGLTLVILVLVSKPLAERHGGFRLTRIELTGAGLVLIPVAAGVDWGRPTAAQWASLVVLGVVHTAAGITLYLNALAVVPATQVGILGYLEPAAVVVASWVFLSDTPSAATTVGGALIITAGLLVIRSGGGDELGATFSEVHVDVPG
ncbi:MAG TPA: DMT family transporter [Acidimicrobiales bacterium]|nr:DMT family transporter [Acidimicrobiales bacterium]